MEPSSARRRASTLLWLSQAIVCISLLACQAPDPAVDVDDSQTVAAARAGEPIQHGYANQGELSVSVADFNRTVAWREWVTGQPIGDAYGPDWTDDDSLLRRLTSMLLDDALLLQDCTRWNLAVSAEERLAALAEIPVVAAVHQAEPDARAAVLDGVGLTWDDVERAADLTVLFDRWNQHRIDGLSEDDLRSAYLRRNNRVRLEVGLVPNVHPGATIQAIVAGRSAEIEEYYADHTNFFLLPRGAQLREVAIAGAADDTASRERAESLRERATAEGIDALVGSDGVNQPITRGNPETWIPQAQFPPAFDVLPGEISQVVRFAEYWVVFELIDVRGREMRPLDDDVRAQIAHHLAREEGPAEAPMARATEVASALRAAPENAEQIYEDNRVLAQTTSEFRPTPNGVIPTLGEAAPLSELVFAEGVRVGAVLGPVHISAGIAVARVIARDRATEEDFQRDREAFTEEFADYMRENAWMARVAEYGSAHEREVDLASLREALAAD